MNGFEKQRQGESRSDDEVRFLAMQGPYGVCRDFLLCCL